MNPAQHPDPASPRPVDGCRAPRRLHHALWPGRIHLLLVVSLLLLLGFPTGVAQTRNEFSPAERKAAVLGKLPAYVGWARRPETSSTPIIIGVLGTDPFGGILEKLIAESRIDGRPLQARYFSAEDTVQDCDLLFVPANQQPRWLELRKQGLAEGVLTIGDSDDFLKLGGMIRIVQSRRYKLEIDLPRARSAGLTISSKLLEISVVIGNRE